MALERVAKWKTGDLCLCCPCGNTPSGAGFVPGALMSRALTSLLIRQDNRISVDKMNFPSAWGT